MLCATYKKIFSNEIFVTCETWWVIWCCIWSTYVLDVYMGWATSSQIITLDRSQVKIFLGRYFVAKKAYSIFVCAFVQFECGNARAATHVRKRSNAEIWLVQYCTVAFVPYIRVYMNSKQRNNNAKKLYNIKFTCHYAIDAKYSGKK